MTPKNTPEYKAFHKAKHWTPRSKVLPAKDLCSPKDPLFPLFSYLYGLSKKLYAQLPERKNGEDAFVHPINIVLALKEAGITDMVTLSVGLIHDYVEEEVDLYKKRKQIREHREGIRILDEYEGHVFENLEKELLVFAKQASLDTKVVQELIVITKLLTRHKRDFYYRTMCNMFTCSDEVIKEKAIQVKLADRMHNILSIECFTEQERIYQCFKNLFILNNTKRYLVERFGEEVLHFKKKRSATEELFKICAESTYDAFLTLCHLCHERGMAEAKSLLQLAFKKFALEVDAVRSVTELNKRETHPMRLYQNVIRKYDSRLHHRWNQFEKMRDDELDYVKKFFADFKFTEAQLQAVLDYKDAYSLKEVVAYLMYVPDYFIAGFEYSDLFCEN